MRIEAIAWALETGAPSPGSKLLLILLSDSANMDSNVVVYAEYIAPRAMLEPKHLNFELNCLGDAGIIDRDPILRLPLDDFIEPGAEVIRLLYPREAGL